LSSFKDRFSRSSEARDSEQTMRPELETPFGRTGLTFLAKKAWRGGASMSPAGPHFLSPTGRSREGSRGDAAPLLSFHPNRRTKPMFDLTHPKLVKLARSKGYAEVMDFLDDNALDSIMPAICMAPDCDHTAELEPDQRAGFCEACGRASMKSGLVIAGMI
jgi:hypothetical protein